MLDSLKGLSSIFFYLILRATLTVGFIIPIAQMRNLGVYLTSKWTRWGFLFCSWSNMEELPNAH